MNVSKAAHENGVSRSTFYRWQQQYIEYGKQGLETTRRVQTSRPKRSIETVETILALSKTHPHWGCIRLAQELNATGKKISSPTVQLILIENGLATQADRSRSLEIDWMEGKIKPTAEQYKSMLRHNPCLGDRSFFRGKNGAQAVGVGVYPLKNLAGTLNGSIVVTINLSNLVAKCFLWVEKHDSKNNNIQRDQILLNIKSFRDKDRPPLLVVYSNNSVYQKNKFENLYHIQSIKIAGGARNIGAIRYFFELLENTFFPIVRNTPSVKLNKLNLMMQTWIDEYEKGHKRNGFPTFGLTPQECKSQIVFPASFCRDVPIE